jgi:hypothetical protein
VSQAQFFITLCLLGGFVNYRPESIHSLNYHCPQLFKGAHHIKDNGVRPARLCNTLYLIRSNQTSRLTMLSDQETALSAVEQVS